MTRGTVALWSINLQHLLHPPNWVRRNRGTAWASFDLTNLEGTAKGGASLFCGFQQAAESERQTV